jgi:hypothetical protein
MSNRHRRTKLPPFVPLYKETMKTPAWIAMSNGARMPYVLLKWNYNIHPRCFEETWFK